MKEQYRPQEQEPILDRKEIAVSLRHLGIDVDFEDWDGLDDNDVLGAIITLAIAHDFDMEEVVKTITPVEKFAEESLDAEAVVEVLREAGVTTLDAETLRQLDVDAMQRTVVWHVKEVGLDFETVGRACFGDAWQEGRWI